MSVEFTPRPYQQHALSFLRRVPRANLWAGMGMGKSSVVLTLLKELEPPDPVLVIAPLRVARSVWPQEAEKWRHLAGMRIVAITGTTGERIDALRTRADLHTVNYDVLPWLVETLGADRWPFRTVIADESTRLKGFRTRQGTARAGSLRGIAHHRVLRWINLTGTPAPNGLIDLWGQQWFIDGGAALGRSFTAFRDRWFGKPAWAGQYGPLIPMPYAQKQIEEALAPSTMSINPADWFDLKAPIVNDVFVDLPPAARAAYRKMERDFFVQLREGTIEAPTAAAKTIKLLQLASGAVYHDDKTWEFVHDEKMDALRSVVEEASGANILVAYQFRHELERLTRAFPHARVLGARRDEDDWNAGRIPLLLAHPQSAGHGLSLQHGGNHIAFVGHDWNLESYQQIIERIGPVRQMQSGYDRPVFIHHILARGTMDETVMQRRRSKRAVQDLLMEAMKAAG